MKVLQVINSLQTGGAEKLLLDTIPYYVEKGIKMDVLLLNGAETPFVKIVRSKNCCTIYNLGLGSVYNPLHIFKIIPYLKKYDIIHAHLFPSFYWLSIAKSLFFSQTIILFTEHSTSNRRFKNKIFSIIDNFIYSNFYKIICISEEVKEVVLNHTKLKEKRLEVISNGVNLNLFIEAVGYERSYIDLCSGDNDFLIIQVSSFQEPKDQPTLIKALQYLPENVRLVLVGEGVLKKNCEALVQQLKLEPRVCFLGIRNDVPQLLKTADVVVLSSKYEGLSLSSIEGMASGKPFIASNVPGLKEVVKGAGILFEQGNSKELARHIKKLLSDDAYYKKIADDGVKRAAKYDISVMVNKHIKLYKSTINGA